MPYLYAASVRISVCGSLRGRAKPEPTVDGEANAVKAVAGWARRGTIAGCHDPFYKHILWTNVASSRT